MSNSNGRFDEIKTMDEIDVKDLQYQVVLCRRKAVQLIVDINNAECKNAIKTIKDIENQPLNPKISYTPLNVQKLRTIEIPEAPKDDNILEQISDIRGVLKVLKRPNRWD